MELRDPDANHVNDAREGDVAKIARTEEEVQASLQSVVEGGVVEAPGVSDAAPGEINALTAALANLREAERELTERSRFTMNISEQDMRALQFLVVSLRRGELVTPSAIANHLRISAASTTKLLNRLERAGHISRELHPSDRRAFKIEISPETEAWAQRSFGRQQARRFLAAARLSSEERLVVTRFLDEVAHGIRRDAESWGHITRHQQPPGHVIESLSADDALPEQD